MNWNVYVCAMLKLIEHAASIIDDSTNRFQSGKRATV
jgi:hypothetical protein